MLIRVPNATNADQWESRPTSSFRTGSALIFDPLTTMAALDRVIHHSVILDMMELESYRARTAQLRLQGEGGELTE